MLTISIIDDNYDDTANYSSEDLQNYVLKKPKRSMPAREIASVIVIVSIISLVIIALILSIIFTK